jgi:nucleoside-diphosphate-sugar epimerase
MTRVLVTGGTGFIGRMALEALRRRGLEVVGVSSRAGGRRPEIDGVRWEAADLLGPGGAERVVADVAPTHLLHLAWYAEPGAFWRSEENLRWVEASLRLLRAFHGAGGRRAVLAGSCAEYAWTEETHCVEGRTPLEPATLYGASKHALRTVAEAYAQETGLSLAWGRVFFVFGPFEHPARLVSSVARALVRGEEAPTSHGEQVRDFLCSLDLGDAFAALLACDVSGPVNLASGEPVRIRDLVEDVARAAGRPDLLRLGARPAPAGEPRALTADVTRLREEVGWSAAGPLADRVEQTVAWWRARERSPTGTGL